MSSFRDYLNLEATYAKVTTVTALAIMVWLYPKYFQAPWQSQVIGGFCATSMTLTAAKSIDRIERRQRLQRAEKAAKQDCFTTELAYMVWKEQLRQEQAIHPLMAVQQQAATTEPPVKQGLQSTSMTPQRQNAPLASEPEALDLNEAIHYPSIIVFGGQGSGKTTLAKAIAQIRASHGHRLQVLDPHGSDWPFPSVGGGMDYDAIEMAMLEYCGEVKQRYSDKHQGETTFAPYTLVAEEMTNYAYRLDKTTVIEYLRTAWCDTRKIKMGNIFVLHANTIEGGFGGAKGLAQLRNASCYQIELFPEIDPQTTEARPSGKGRLYRPGMPPVEIVVPLLMPNNAIQPVNNLKTGHEETEYRAGNDYSSFSTALFIPSKSSKRAYSRAFFLVGEGEIYSNHASHCNPLPQAQID